jgi:hypothetical protein
MLLDLTDYHHFDHGFKGEVFDVVGSHLFPIPQNGHAVTDLIDLAATVRDRNKADGLFLLQPVDHLEKIFS